MFRFVCGVLVALFVHGSALAQARPPLTIADALSMLSGLKALDGHQVIVKETTVTVPWEFSSGVLRFRIARNISLLAKIEAQVEESRKAIIKSILDNVEPDKEGRRPPAITQGSPEMEELLRQFGELLRQPAEGSDSLIRFKIADLRLDKNEIPLTVITSLLPILDE